MAGWPAGRSVHCQRRAASLGSPHDRNHRHHSERSRRPLGNPRAPPAARRRQAQIADQLSAQGVEPARRDQGRAGADLPAAVLRRFVRPPRRTPQRRAAGQRRRAADRTRRRGQRATHRSRYLHRAVGWESAQRNPRPRCRSFARNRRERQAHHLGRARPRPLPRRRPGFARRNRQRDRQGSRQEKAGAGLCHRLHHRQLPDRLARQRSVGGQRRRRGHCRSRWIAPLLQRLDGPPRHHREHLPRRHFQKRGRTLPARRPVTRGERGQSRLCQRAVGQLADRRQKGASGGQDRRVYRRHRRRGACRGQ